MELTYEPSGTCGSKGILLQNPDGKIKEIHAQITGNLKRRFTIEELSSLYEIPLTKGKTLLVIAHRLSTITDADQIVVLKNGHVEAKGTQDELLQICPLYKRMW